jgi:Na+/melibiose symporter-like transporter
MRAMAFTFRRRFALTLLSAMLLDILDIAVVKSGKLRSGFAVGAKEFVKLCM